MKIRIHIQTRNHPNSPTNQIPNASDSDPFESVRILIKSHPFTSNPCHSPPPPLSSPDGTAAPQVLNTADKHRTVHFTPALHSSPNGQSHSQTFIVGKTGQSGRAEVPMALARPRGQGRRRRWTHWGGLLGTGASWQVVNNVVRMYSCCTCSCLIR